MPEIGVPELLIILVIILLLFGPGRIGKMGGELGKGIREFRMGLQGDKPSKDDEDEKQTEAASQPVRVVESTTEAVGEPKTKTPSEPS